MDTEHLRSWVTFIHWNWGWELSGHKVTKASSGRLVMLQDGQTASRGPLVCLRGWEVAQLGRGAGFQLARMGC